MESSGEWMITNVFIFPGGSSLQKKFNWSDINGNEVRTINDSVVFSKNVFNYVYVSES